MLLPVSDLVWCMHLSSRVSAGGVRLHWSLKACRLIWLSAQHKIVIEWLCVTSQIGIDCPDVSSTKGCSASRCVSRAWNSHARIPCTAAVEIDLFQMEGPCHVASSIPPANLREVIVFLHDGTKDGKADGRSAPGLAVSGAARFDLRLKVDGDSMGNRIG